MGRGGAAAAAAAAMEEDEEAARSCIPAMEGGDGPDSYANSSHSQNNLFHSIAKPCLLEAFRIHALPQLDPPPSCLRIADFGCSHGRNALDCAELILPIIQQRCLHALDVHYFFSDLPSNDFNNLFRVLQSSALLGPRRKQADHAVQVYSAGVPGSFYGPLFPEASLHLAISSFALHWLSQVPPAVIDPTSPAWNGGHIWIDGRRPKVCEAYAQQCQSDLKRFLSCRAQELASGAIALVFSLSRPQEHPTGAYAHFDIWSEILEPTWNEAVSQGLVNATERDMFNVPIYNFSGPEFEVAVQDVPQLELLKVTVTESEFIKLDHPHEFGVYWTNFTMSLIKPMVKAHIGEERVAQFSNMMQRIATQRAHLAKSMPTSCHFLVALLRRK